MNSIDSLLRILDAPLPSDSAPRLEITLHLGMLSGKPQLHIALRAGLDKLYVVRNLPAFLRMLDSGEALSFGRVTIEPEGLQWPRQDALILQVLKEIEAAQRPYDTQIAHPDSKTRKFMAIPDPTAPRLLRLLASRPFRLAVRGEQCRVGGVEREPLPLRFDVTSRGENWLLFARIAVDAAALTSACDFVFSAGRVHQLDARQAPIVRALLDARSARDIGIGRDINRIEFPLPTDQLDSLVAELFPRLQTAGELNIAPELNERIEHGALDAAVYLDREGTQILAKVEFHYGERSIDPFAPTSIESQQFKQPKPPNLLMRDAGAEHGVLEELSRAGFRVRSGHAFLENAQQTLAFFLDGVQSLMKRSSVYCSDRFQRMRPRRPSLSGRLTARGGFIQFIMMMDDEPAPDLLELLAALRDRRRYFRLKDGTFLDLEGLEGWEPFARELADSATDGAAWVNPDGLIETAVYRVPDWAALLDGSTLPVTLDDSIKQATAAYDVGALPPPEGLNATLRPYQMEGFAWLLARYGMGMGGVLADDMGLGKTIQMITALLSVKSKEGPRLSMVVAPTSLLYNWLAEVKRFAPGLEAIVIEGGPTQRKKQWEGLITSDTVDLVITSYPLLRRDMDDIEQLNYRMIILDEAQQIKNAKAYSTMLVKRLHADARFALTGTPMENHPGELWSIFDFVVPGYLLSINQFMARHGAGQDSESLRRKIRPFLLRRLKRDVLFDLPEKTEQIMWVDMPLAQRRVYQAATIRAREKVEHMISSRGFAVSRFEILSLIMELRQICCHPSLKFEGYDGSSGKLDALTDLLPGALENGHRILLFSQFTRMLKFLETQFHAEGITCLYLDGQTPTRERLSLADRFNAGEGQLFLISLKAGGAGLNLIGADMVVHYDPWWNPAAEDQASDRAHRIGQTHAVQVIRLITRNTIEERVDALSQRKRALYEAIIPSESSFEPGQISEDDVRMLLMDELEDVGG
ncbi:helicase [Clostridia bacterium]|nr:helicase [Clostridia bacterium]